MAKVCKTLVVGGAFRTKNGQLFVQKRSWEMIRIFSDHMSHPVFAMLEAPLDETLDYKLPRGIEVVRLPTVVGPPKIINTLMNRALTQEIRRIVDQCYAIYVRLPAWFCWDIFKYALSRKRKILASYHGDWVDDYRQINSGFVKYCLSFGFSFYIEHILRKMARHCEALFCVGQDLADMYGHLAKRKIIFANFLHSEDDISSPRELCAKPPYKILFVGGVEVRKGIDYLIKALAILRGKGIETNLTIVGAGPLKEKLMALANSIGIGQNVEFKKYIQHGKELMAIYRSADIFVLPSICGEGTPKVVMEAMSQATPVIATDTGSTKYLLDEGKYGILVPPKDSESLACAIQRIVEDKVLREKLVRHGLDLARHSTIEKQKQIVRNGLFDVLPEIVGDAQYFNDLNVAQD